MDPDSGADTQRTISLQWKSYKLVQDPAIRRVTQKIYRYDGIHFSVPDSAFPPVGELRDPRPRRIWSRHTEMLLPLPKFKLDEYYVGPFPLKEVTFARLNDNIKEPFLLEMCAKFGEVEEMEILFHPKTRKHLGLARVLFTSTRGAKDTVKHLHNTSIMGNIVHAQLDIKGEQRMKYYNLIVSGSYTPQTVPTGGKALTDKFQPPAPAQPDTSSDIRRKLSTDQMTLDAGFAEQRLDTPPSSLGGPYTPGSSCSSQGGNTPYTSRSGTPFSQDSGYSGGRPAGYSGGPPCSGYPPQDMLPSSSCSSSAVSSSSGFKPPRYYDDPHGVPPQDPSVFQRGRPGFPPPQGYPPYHNAGGPGMHMPPHPHMPPSGSMYESPPVTERERERERDRDRDRGPRERDRDRDSGRFGARRSSYHQDVNSSSSSKSSYHSHHREERDGRTYRRDSSGSRDHGRHRNHHHSHNHHGRRRDSRDRERDGDYSNSSDPRYRGGHTNSSHRSSNSLSPPPASFGYNPPKDPAPHDTPSSSRLDPSPTFRSGERASAGDAGYRSHSHQAPLHPPPPPPPLPPASVIAAAVAETLSSLDFSQESPVREDQWSKLKRRPSTPPQPPCTPPPSSPPHASVPSSSTSPSSTSLPHHLPSSTASLSSPQAQRGDSSPEPDSTNESLPFMHHSSSLDSRIEMLLKDQKSKFSFLASDDEEEEDKKEDSRQDNGRADSRKRREEAGDREGGQHRRDGRRSRGRKAGGGEARKSPTATVPPAPPMTDSAQGQQGPPQVEPTPLDAQKPTGAHTPPPQNGEGHASPHSSGEDMEISDEDDSGIATVTPHHGSSPAPSSQPPLPSQTADPSAGTPPDSTQHFGTSMPPPHLPSYPPHLPPPPPPGFSLQPPPPPHGVPPPLPHMDLHPEYPPPPHMYDYASSVELLSQYGGTSFQMQAHMISRLHQMREKHAPGSEYPASYHLHSMPPPHAPPPGHLYMDQDGTAGNHYDQDHRYMPPHMPSYPYPDPHATQLPPPHPHSMPPPPHAAWPPHVLPRHYPSHYPPPGYTAIPGVEGEQYPMPPVDQNPHEATVQLVLASLIDEMKNTMQRDLNRKMVENVAFGTFDQWWERKERKAKPFQTALRVVSEEKKEEKTSSRPREPLMSLVDWAKSGGVEGFSMLGSLRLPSFKVKRKEPQELAEDASLKRARPSTPPDEEDEDSYQGKDADSISRPVENRAAERAAAKRRKRPRARKPYDLDSEGEETSDESSSEKEEDESEKDDSDDEAVSADSDDESVSSSSGSSSSSSSSSTTSSSDEEDEDDEDLERPEESESLDTMDESTMDSVAMDTHKEKETASVGQAPGVAPAEVKAEEQSAAAAATDHRPSSPPCPRPSSPILPPLKKRRKTVSFTTEESEAKPSAPPSAAPLSPSSSLSPALLLSPVKSQPPDQLITSSPVATPTGTPPSKPLPMLCPFASRPDKANLPSSSLSNVLTVPPPVRSLRPEEPRKSPQPPPAKSPSRRAAGKESPRPAPAAPVCLTVQNLPLDHASLVRVAYEEPTPTTPFQKGRPRGRARTSSQSVLTLEDEDEDEGRQLGSADAPDLSVLAHVASKMDADEDVDSEETETSDEAEEHKQDEEAWRLRLDPDGMFVLHEHNYSRSPSLLAPAPVTAAQKRTKPDPAVVLSADFNQNCVQEAPEEVIGDVAEQHGPGPVSGMGLVGEAGESAEPRAVSPASKRKGSLRREDEPDKGTSKQRTRKDKDSAELQPAKKQKDELIKAQRKGKLEDLEEDVDVEQLETGDFSSSSSDSGDSDFGPDERVKFEKEEVRKSERLFLQEAGVTPSTQRKPSQTAVPPPPPPPAYKNRSEFEQMTILYDIWNTGLDQEDMRLLKVTYDKLLQDDQNTDWLNDTHWVTHPITNIPNPRRKKKAADGQLREHVTGSARSEGYYAISRKEKDVYLDLEMPETDKAVDYETAGSNRLLAERRSEQRRLLSAIGTAAVMDSDLLKLNQLKFRKKKLRFGRSRIHEWGLFAMEPIAADEMVIEYVGQNIRQMVADTREKRYAQEGIGSSYLFRVDHDTIIDATKCGNLARFINHCCTPNCYAKVITIESQKKIVIYSKQPIAVNEEITYDYKFPIEENKIPCLCGTENCRGTLN